MLQDTDSVPRTIIDQIVAQLERLMDEALDKWSLPKRDSEQLYWIWSSKQQAYLEALRLLAKAGLAPKYVRE